jgi:hypothetical protein
MVEEMLREELVRKRKYRVEFHNCGAGDLLQHVDLLKPDIVVTTTRVSPENLAAWSRQGIRYFKGLPFLTGTGVDALIREVTALLDEVEAGGSAAAGPEDTET